MKKQIMAFLAGGILVFAVGAATQTTGSTGRYELGMSHQSTAPYVIDTATGRVWVIGRDHEDNHVWLSRGQPTD